MRGMRPLDLSIQVSITIFDTLCFHKMQPRTARLDHRNLVLLKHWTWQFVIIRPICSILMITLQMLGIYPSWLSWTFTIILNISVSVALYSLVLFYHVFAKELAPHKPLAKFLCIKGVVFFCFWQVNILPILFQLLIKGVFLALDANQTLEGSKSTKGAPKNLKQTNQISLSPDRIEKRRVLLVNPIITILETFGTLCK